VIGTAAIEGVSFFLADREEVKSFWPVILGLIMLIVVAYKPTGLLGFLVSQRERFGTFGIAKSRALRREAARTVREAGKEGRREGHKEGPKEGERGVA
jgi:hypothetical protein